MRRDHEVMTRVAKLGLLVVAIVCTRADPVSAHGVAGAEPTNYATRIVSTEPAIEGIELRSVDLGDQLELRNTTGAEVLVLGYRDEPYLRVGPDGVFENRASPSWAANRTSDDEIPVGAVVEGEDPEWVRIGSGDTVRWHDHRAHWMGTSTPPAVDDHPDREQRVSEFEVLLRQDGRDIVVSGEVVWVPGPTPWPWATAAAGLALAFVLASRSRVWPIAFGLALVVVVATEVVHVAGTWGATTGSTITNLAASVYSIAGITVAIGALVWLARSRDPYDATPLILVAGLFLAVAGGFADLTTLTRSELPTTLAPTVARAAVTITLGLGSGLAIGAGMRLRRPAPRAAGVAS